MENGVQRNIGRINEYTGWRNQYIYMCVYVEHTVIYKNCKVIPAMPV